MAYLDKLEPTEAFARLVKGLHKVTGGLEGLFEALKRSLEAAFRCLWLKV